MRLVCVGGSLLQESLNTASNFILSHVRWVLWATKPLLAHLRSTRHQEAHWTLALTLWDQNTLNFLLSASTTLKKKIGERRGTRGVTLQG